MSSENQANEVKVDDIVPDPEVVKKIDDALANFDLDFDNQQKPENNDNSSNHSDYQEGLEIEDSVSHNNESQLSDFEGDGNAFDTNLYANSDLKANAHVVLNVNDELGGCKTQAKVDVPANLNSKVEISTDKTQPLIDNQPKRNKGRMCLCVSIGVSFLTIASIILGAFIVLAVKNTDIFGKKINWLFAITFGLTCPLVMLILCILSWIGYYRLNNMRDDDTLDLNSDTRPTKKEYALSADEPYV